MFRVEITGVLSAYYDNGRVKSILACRNAVGGYSEMETDISASARESLPFIFDGPKPKPSAFRRWINGEYPVPDWLENLIVHDEARKLTSSPERQLAKPPGRQLAKPPENGNGKRKLIMDRKLRTWIIDAEGPKKKISCREICEKFDGRIVTRLRAGIDSGADISTEEIDD